MSTSNAVWAMNVAAAHKKQHGQASMSQCTEMCRRALRILEEDEEAKRRGGIGRR